MGKKRFLWKEMAEELTTQFKRFKVERVARKWTTLEESYKKAVDNNSSTGKAPTKFQFFKDMGEHVMLPWRRADAQRLSASFRCFVFCLIYVFLFNLLLF